ncbi:MAG: beta-ketoacyl-[acyl-carrier-protein] synthase family protein [Pseudomonadota bacterium]
MVSGMGAVSALGHNVPDMWEALIAGRCGIGPLTRLDPARHRIKHAAQVSPLPDEANDSPTDPAIRFALMAGNEALDQAGVSVEQRGDVALVLGTNFGAMSTTTQFLVNSSSASATQALHDDAVRIVAEKLGLHGIRSALSLSCASGNAAIGYAADLIRSGRAKMVLAGGYDAISKVVWAGLCSLRAMSPHALRPFDRRRDGTIFGEGAGLLLLESAEHAHARSTEFFGEFLGYATSSNAFHMTHPDEHGEGMARAMRGALRDAEIDPTEVDHINAHGTGTPANDKLETAAIKTVFGKRAATLPINGIKSMLGHAMGAASALEAIATIMTIREGIIPPTIGLEEPDPECDLDYCALQARRAEVRVALNNSAGFGGCNAATIFARGEPDND